MNLTARRIIGVDESGKGDFFGPLVVASVYAEKSDESKLIELGVRDSKQIADKKLVEIAEILQYTYPHSIKIYHPKDYNRLHKKIKNLNKMLAEGHANTIKNVVDEHSADMAVSDKFGKTELIENELNKISCDIELYQLIKGERIIQVAAASIIARATFLEEMYKLSKEIGINLPKGASVQVDEIGRKIANQHGIKIFEQISKTHFKNYQRIINPTLFTA
jgi:ribonuclease HIII